MPGADPERRSFEAGASSRTTPESIGLAGRRTRRPRTWGPIGARGRTGAGTAMTLGGGEEGVRVVTGPGLLIAWAAEQDGRDH